MRATHASLSKLFVRAQWALCRPAQQWCLSPPPQRLPWRCIGRVRRGIQHILITPDNSRALSVHVRVPGHGVLALQGSKVIARGGSTMPAAQPQHAAGVCPVLVATILGHAQVEVSEACGSGKSNKEGLGRRHSQGVGL